MRKPFGFVWGSALLAWVSLFASLSVLLCSCDDGRSMKACPSVRTEANGVDIMTVEHDSHLYVVARRTNGVEGLVMLHSPNCPCNAVGVRTSKPSEGDSMSFAAIGLGNMESFRVENGNVVEFNGEALGIPLSVDLFDFRGIQEHRRKPENASGVVEKELE